MKSKGSFWHKAPWNLKDTLDVVQNDAEHMVVTRLKQRNEDVAKLEGVFRAIDKTQSGLINEEQLQQILSQSSVRASVCANSRVTSHQFHVRPSVLHGSKSKVIAYLQTLELDVHEGHALFHILDNGDGEVLVERTRLSSSPCLAMCVGVGLTVWMLRVIAKQVTLDEFIDGLMRCKGAARAAKRHLSSGEQDAFETRAQAIDQVAMHADMKNLDKKLNQILSQMSWRPDNSLTPRRAVPSPRTQVLRRQVTQAAHLKAFRFNPENDERRRSIV